MKLGQQAMEALKSQIDGALEAHVDRNAVLDDLPLFASDPESAALILMIVRSGEASRRLLPSCPIVSSRSFVERAWPSMLGWSDMGRHGQERLRAADLADAEFHRLEKRRTCPGRDHGHAGRLARHHAGTTPRAHGRGRARAHGRAAQGCRAVRPGSAGADGLRGARTRGVRARVARWRRWYFRTCGLLLPELKSLLLLSACMV